MKEILREILDAIARGEGAALVSIVSAKGSLPMSRRSRMLVLAGGAQHGTVGGGCLEADVHAMGRQAIRSAEASIRRFTLTEAGAGIDGLNCGGTVEMLIEPLGGSAGPAQVEIFRQALAALDERVEVVMATALAAAPGTAVLGKGLISSSGMRIGTGALEASPALRERAVEEALAILGQDRASIVTAPDGERLFLETVNAPPSLYLFGGGHVSLAVARVARAAGFRVVVVDDRPAFANPDRFPEADETLVLPMEEAFAHLPIDAGSYIVAVTRGHQHDEPVIEQAIRTPAAYIGMMGSKRKVAIMWERLKARGATDEALARVHAPIGLPIGADTPGEIAVSIVAQLVEARRLGARQR
ncbi:MAG TPA: XdhC family protein [Candidatus Polarisedimenticolia bacterium]|jgi:xanthine dehydrogenase accessory factor